MNLAASIRASLLADVPYTTSRLGTFNGEPAVLTKRPVPEQASYPMIVISADVTITEQDGVNDFRPVITKDIIAYGDNADQYRVVEELGYRLRELFHRKRNAVSADGYNVVLVTAVGPYPAPTDDAEQVARRITLTISLAKAN